MSLSGRLPTGYCLRLGSGLDRALLVKFMQRTYQEMATVDSYAHLVHTVEQYLSPETPLWWVMPDGDRLDVPQRSERSIDHAHSPSACLWLGTAIDQVKGDRHSHIFLLYVLPEYRRKGIGRALMHHAETWAIARGDRQIGLQVFQTNEAALNLYRSLGFQAQSVWMVKGLGNRLQ